MAIEAPAALAEASLPVDTYRDAAPHLRRPFTAEAMKFKVQATWPKGDPKTALIVPYIDARLVIERFNLVCPHLWAATNTALSKDTLLLCRLTVDGITREDVGESPKKLSKDVFSDALKRAAVHFGVGVSLYALPQITLSMGSGEKRIEKRGQGERATLVLTEHGHTKLRAGYAKWLEEIGETKFGPVLDHGDTVGETVDVDAEAPEEFVPPAPEALSDEAGEALIAEVRAAYDALTEDAKKSLPPARFNAWLTGAWHSHDGLRQLLEVVQGRGGAS